MSSQSSTNSPVSEFDFSFAIYTQQSSGGANGHTSKTSDSDILRLSIDTASSSSAAFTSLAFTSVAHSHYESDSQLHSRHSSFSSNSFTESSLCSLEQISLLPSTNTSIASLSSAAAMFITPPQESKSFFNRVLFEEEPDCDALVVEDWPYFDQFKNNLSNRCFWENEKGLTGDEEDEYNLSFSCSNFDSVDAEFQSSQLIGLGISTNDASNETDEIDKRDRESVSPAIPEIETGNLPPKIIPKPSRRAKSKALEVLKSFSNDEREEKHERKKLASSKMVIKISKPKFSAKGKPKVTDPRIKVVSNKEVENGYTFDPHTGLFSCATCSTTFARLEHLKRHFRSLHSNYRPFKCNTCSKSFARSDNLLQHVKVHMRTNSAETKPRAKSVMGDSATRLRKKRQKR